MKKRILALLLALTLVLSACGTNDKKDGEEKPGTSEETPATDKEEEKEQDSAKEEFKDGTYEASAPGFGGEIKLSVEVKDNKISDIEILEDKETDPVFNRAFPVIKERILAEQSPVVDNVSAATFSSYGVKKAVGLALKDAGVDFGEITMTTEPDHGGIEEKEDVNTQLVVVGGGPAGLTAAIEAKDNGVKDVILVEKLDILSGNGKFDMNFFDMLNSKAMKENNVEVTKEEFLEAKEAAVDSDERKAVWVDGAWELDEWIRSIGIELNYNYGGDKGTSHMAEANEYAGDHIQEKLEERAIELGVNIITGTKGVDLIIEDGKATGVKVEDRTSKYNIMADAVVVATGGFSANKDLLKEYAPGGEIVETSNQMGATGDFVKVFEDHDLKMDHMDVLTVFKLIIKNRRDLTGAGDGFVLVNKDGKRFAAENEGGLDLAHKILEQEDGKVFYIYDQALYESFYRLQKHNDLGYHVKADTIEELAEKIDLDAKTLEETINKYNAACEGKEKDEFREEMPEKPFDMNGPFYACQVESAIHMTKGGVVANEKAEVINNSDQVVEGLYAAGEVTDTSGNYSAAVVFGRVAGQEAAKFINK